MSNFDESGDLSASADTGMGSPINPKHHQHDDDDDDDDDDPQVQTGTTGKSGGRPTNDDDDEFDFLNQSAQGRQGGGQQTEKGLGSSQVVHDQHHDEAVEVSSGEDEDHSVASSAAGSPQNKMPTGGGGSGASRSQPQNQSQAGAERERGGSAQPNTHNRSQSKPQQQQEESEEEEEEEEEEEQDDDHHTTKQPANKSSANIKTQAQTQQQQQSQQQQSQSQQQTNKGGHNAGTAGHSSSESESEEEEEDNGQSAPHQAKLYNPADYAHLVGNNKDYQDLFNYISHYKPAEIELETKLKPFIPDYIPAVGEIDNFLKIPPPDDSTDGLGLTVLDEPAAQQSDQTVLELKLRNLYKQTNLKPVTVRSIENADKNPKKITKWIQSIDEIHRSKPPPMVAYSRKMPEIEDLMQAWPKEFEQILKTTPLPSGDIDLTTEQFARVICATLDIPVYDGKITESLHVLFTLYSEFKNNAHFQHS